MTGRFETLIYTDCRPGQGLQGSAGLQFQARSSAAASAAAPLVQRHLLYEAQSRWIAERRPVAEYPTSFAHVSVDGYLATAVGVYLGREANGSREGNQLTHSVVTQDPADYQGLRPAQLFGAAFWTGTPAATTESAPVELDPKATPYSPARARDFVLRQPDGRETLLALVSALETAGQPGSCRVLFVGDDVATIVEWLVAGTFLVPRGRALELGFKIFSTEPGRAGVPIVAVHREFAGSAAQLDNQLGYAVFDVDRARHSPVETTESAARWVELFLTDDTNDVVDACDVGAVCGLKPESTAAALGMAAIMHATPGSEHAEPIVDWLRTGPQHLRNAYATDVAELFAETPGRWTRRVLVLLDAVGCDGLIPGRAASVRLALIHSEVAAARDHAEVTDERVRVLPDREWGAEDTHVAKRMLVNALDSGVPPEHVDALLRVATRFEVDIRCADFPQTAWAFVGHWADCTESAFDSARWRCRVELEDLVVQRLAERVSADERQAAFLVAGWWHWLLARSELPDPLLAAALGAGIHYTPARQSFVDSHLAAASDSPGRYAWTVGALWSQTEATLDELRIVREQAPDGVALPQHVFGPFVSRVCGAGPLELGELRLCLDLVHDKLLRPTEKLRKVLADDAAVLAAVDLLMTGLADDAAQRGALHELRRRPDRLVTLRAARVIDGLLQAGDPAGVVATLQTHPGLIGPYATQLAGTLPGPASARQAVIALCFSLHLPPNDPQREQVLKALGQWLVRATDRQLEAARDRFAPLDRRWREVWDLFVRETRGSRRRYRLVHPLRDR